MIIGDRISNIYEYMSTLSVFNQIAAKHAFKFIHQTLEHETNVPSNQI